jgi:exopolyphosphatase/guanosine-5'-triphosphate,3'-diphosphate pyrophosphatase
LEHADMPGFSNDDQALLALIVLGHQGKIEKVKVREPTRATWLTLLCLRLAVSLSRRREDLTLLPIGVEVEEKTIRLIADKSWLATHSLSEYSLRGEVTEWNKAGFSCQMIER